MQRGRESSTSCLRLSDCIVWSEWNSHIETNLKEVPVQREIVASLVISAVISGKAQWKVSVLRLLSIERKRENLSQ